MLISHPLCVHSETSATHHALRVVTGRVPAALAASVFRRVIARALACKPRVSKYNAPRAPFEAEGSERASGRTSWAAPISASLIFSALAMSFSNSKSTLPFSIVAVDAWSDTERWSSGGGINRAAAQGQGGLV